MDGRGKKRIGQALVIWLVFVFVLSGAVFLLGTAESAREQRLMLTLLAEHPELEGELISYWEKEEPDPADEKEQKGLMSELREKYGYGRTWAGGRREIGMCWGIGLAMGTAFLMMVFVYSGKQRKGWRRCLLEIYECLEGFRKGAFTEIYKVPYEENASEEEMKIRESMQELGSYFHNLKARLEEEENNTKALITDISHQLKTPLSSLKISHELVQKGDLTEEEKKEFLIQEGKEIDKLEMLMKELVDLSRLEVHMIQIRPVPAGIRQTITEAVDRVYLKAREKRIEIQVEMDRDMLAAHDPKWTQEAISNVLDNAVKYSPENTCVTLRATPLITNILIEVEDQGAGITSGEMAKIYQRFYRGEEAVRSVKEGAGVGLYLARVILERQGGTISAKSDIGKGTVFRLTLPLKSLID